MRKPIFLQTGYQAKDGDSLSTVFKEGGLDYHIREDRVCTYENLGLPNYKALVADRNDGRPTVTGLVKQSYSVLQNQQVFDLAQGIIDTDKVKIQSAGHFYDSRKCFISYKFGEDRKLGPDTLNPYLFLHWGHDGNTPLSISVMIYRMICTNGLMGFSKSTSMTVKHTSGIYFKANNIMQSMAKAEDILDHQVDRYQTMINSGFTYSEAKEFFKKTFNIDDSPKCKDAKKLDILCHLYTGGTGHIDIKNTKWAAFNAVAEYLDHYSNHKKAKDTGLRFDSELNSTFYGNSSNIKDKALQLLAA